MINDKQLWWRSRYGNWLHYSSLLAMLVFMVPTAGILISWNSVPGDYVHPIKLELEDFALRVVDSNFVLASSLNSRYVVNRFAEAAILLVEQNREDGFDYLTSQIDEATDHIYNREAETTLIADVEATQQIIDQVNELQNTLNEVNEELDQTSVGEETIVFSPSPNVDTNASQNNESSVGDTNTQTQNGGSGVVPSTDPEPRNTGSSSETNDTPVVTPNPSPAVAVPSIVYPSAPIASFNSSPIPSQSKASHSRKRRIESEHLKRHSKKVEETKKHIEDKLEELDEIKHRCQEKELREKKEQDQNNRRDNNDAGHEGKPGRRKSR